MPNKLNVIKKKIRDSNLLYLKINLIPKLGVSNFEIINFNSLLHFIYLLKNLFLSHETEEAKLYHDHCSFLTFRRKEITSTNQRLVSYTCKLQSAPAEDTWSICIQYSS